MPDGLRQWQPPRLSRTVTYCPLLDQHSAPEAWVACCTKRFLPLARRIAGSDDIAEDALQESWIRVMKHVCNYRGESPACAWAGAVVANCAKDREVKERLHRERVAAAPVASISDARSNPEVIASDRELHRLLHAVVDVLPDKYRDVYEMRNVRALSTSETARLLGISKHTVATRLKRAVRRVKKILAVRLRAPAEEESPATAETLGP